MSQIGFLTAVWMWCRGTRFRDPGSAGRTVRLDDLKGLFQADDAAVLWNVTELKDDCKQTNPGLLSSSVYEADVPPLV